MNEFTTTRESLKTFAIAVTVIAATLGLAHASAYTEGPCYYVAYRTQKGHLVRTEAHITEQAALLAFKQSAQVAIANNH